MAKLSKILLFLGLMAFTGASLARSSGPQRPTVRKQAPTTPPAAPKITTPEMRWVDAPGIWGNPNGNGNGGSAADAGKGSGKGSGSGKGTEFTRPGAGNGGGSGGGKGDGGGGDGGGQATTRSTPGGNLRTHSLWWPICAFLDEGVPEGQGNAAIKGMIEMADACGVNVVVWPKTVKNSSWRDDFAYINQQSVAKCNLPPELATAGSATALVPWELTAARMCDDRLERDGIPGQGNDDYNPRVAGCAQMRAGTTLTPKQQAAMQAGGHGGGTASGGVGPSIEVPSGWNAGTVAHEAQGHTQMGKPNGTVHGNGIGEDQEIEGEGSPGGGWTGSGCAVMRATALPNTRNFSFDPSRETYYVKPRNADDYYDIANDPPIFGEMQEVALNGRNGQVQTPPGQTIEMVDDPKTQNPSDVNEIATKSGTTKMEDGEEGRHRKKGMVAQLLDTLKEAQTGTIDEKEETPGQVRKPEPPGKEPPLKAGPRVGYDDNAAKGRAGKVAGGGETVTSAEAPPKEIYDNSGDVAFEAPPASSSGSASFSGGNGKGATLTYDESVAKGGSWAPGSPSEGRSVTASVGREERSANTAAERTPQVIRASVGEWRSSLTEEEDFFEELDENGNPIKRRKKERAARSLGRPQRGLPGPSAADPVLRNRRAPASLP